jgi:hypothetical protein
MAKNKDQNGPIRKHVVDLLSGKGAHASFDDVIKDLPANLRGKKPEGFPHSVWMLVEHIRIAQWDMLEFSRDKKHKSPQWPSGYWPKAEAPADSEAWKQSVKQFHRDLKAMQDLVADQETDLFAKIPWGDGQTILKEALQLADHNAYTVAQIVDVRRMLGAWKG